MTIPFWKLMRPLLLPVAKTAQAASHLLDLVHALINVLQVTRLPWTARDKLCGKPRATNLPFKGMVAIPFLVTLGMLYHWVCHMYL